MRFVMSGISNTGSYEAWVPLPKVLVESMTKTDSAEREKSLVDAYMKDSLVLTTYSAWANANHAFIEAYKKEYPKLVELQNAAEKARVMYWNTAGGSAMDTLSTITGTVTGAVSTIFTSRAQKTEIDVLRDQLYLHSIGVCSNEQLAQNPMLQRSFSKLHWKSIELPGDLITILNTLKPHELKHFLTIPFYIAGRSEGIPQTLLYVPALAVEIGKKDNKKLKFTESQLELSPAQIVTHLLKEENGTTLINSVEDFESLAVWLDRLNLDQLKEVFSKRDAQGALPFASSYASTAWPWLSKLDSLTLNRMMLDPTYESKPNAPSQAGFDNPEVIQGLGEKVVEKSKEGSDTFTLFLRTSYKPANAKENHLYQLLAGGLLDQTILEGMHRAWDFNIGPRPSEGGEPRDFTETEIKEKIFKWLDTNLDPVKAAEALTLCVYLQKPDWIIGYLDSLVKKGGSDRAGKIIEQLDATTIKFVLKECVDPSQVEETLKLFATHALRTDKSDECLVYLMAPKYNIQWVKRNAFESPDEAIAQIGEGLQEPLFETLLPVINEVKTPVEVFVALRAHSQSLIDPFLRPKIVKYLAENSQSFNPLERNDMINRMCNPIYHDRDKTALHNKECLVALLPLLFDTSADSKAALMYLSWKDKSGKTPFDYLNK